MAIKWGWEKQWKAQDGLCWICLEPMDLEPSQGVTLAELSFLTQSNPEAKA